MLTPRFLSLFGRTPTPWADCLLLRHHETGTFIQTHLITWPRLRNRAARRFHNSNLLGEWVQDSQSPVSGHHRLNGSEWWLTVLTANDSLTCHCASISLANYNIKRWLLSGTVPDSISKQSLWATGYTKPDFTCSPLRQAYIGNTLSQTAFQAGVILWLSCIYQLSWHLKSS